MYKVIGLFENEQSAKSTVEEIKSKGISEERISLVAKNNEAEDMEAGTQTQTQTKTRRGNQTDGIGDGIATGGALGGIAGILAGAGMLAIPGVGPILAAGPLAAGISGLAAGGIAGGLIDYGLDEEQGQRYAKEIERGRILVAVEDEEETRIDDIAAMMENRGAFEVETELE